eukprot:GHVN01038308.1.p2 GENE.GHVN01038308.1~~GHVN01038308.1.p2  ORF type:complete len:110 (+),score=21.24 GHVN01038308.1:27-356(+)
MTNVTLSTSRSVTDISLITPDRTKGLSHQSPRISSKKCNVGRHHSLSPVGPTFSPSVVRPELFRGDGVRDVGAVEIEVVRPLTASEADPQAEVWLAVSKCGPQSRSLMH